MDFILQYWPLITFVLAAAVGWGTHAAIIRQHTREIRDNRGDIERLDTRTTTNENEWKAVVTDIDWIKEALKRIEKLIT